MTIRLQPGSPAPRFQLDDIWGSPVDLAEYRGKVLLLSFYRNSTCPLCSLRVNQLVIRAARYEARGLKMVAVFESPAEQVLQQVRRWEMPFPVIADPDGELYQQYSVENGTPDAAVFFGHALTQTRLSEAEREGFVVLDEPGSNLFRLPADFLIGRDGLLLKAFYAEVLGEHLPLSEIERAL
jgi:thioredoxin-dependent peroxiredoxin